MVTEMTQQVAMGCVPPILVPNYEQDPAKAGHGHLTSVAQVVRNRPLPDGETVIILDTCVLTTLPWNSTVWELFRAVRSAGNPRAAVSEMVLAELLAQREREYQAALDKAHGAHQGLWSLQFGETSGGFAHWPVVLGTDTHVAQWDVLYWQVLEVLPLSREGAVGGCGVRRSGSARPSPPGKAPSAPETLRSG
jgi:hypothetical protein